MCRRFLQVALITSVCAAPPAQAQTPTPDSASHWGVSGAIVPAWRTPSSAAAVFDAETADVHGAEFRIGVTRGRTLSGEWAVSFVRKTFAPDGMVRRGGGASCFNADCANYGAELRTSALSLTGVEIDKFVPFGTIRRRAQIGIVFGGGVGRLKGALTERQFFPELLRDPRGIPTGMRQGEVVRQVDASRLMTGDLTTVPLFKFEIAAAGIVASNLKVRVSGGLNFPGTQRVSFGATYFFGAR